MAHRQTTLKDALQYPQDIIDGKIISCELVKMACERHFADLERAKTSNSLYFDEKKAAYALRFFSLCCHAKGEYAGKPIELMHWQAFLVASLHGWQMKRSGRWTRRFRRMYSEVARKNAKSTLLSSLGLLACGMDGEGGSEVYAAATTRDQAKIVWGDAREMVRKSPPLKSLFKPMRDGIHLRGDNSIFRAISSDANTLDGLSCHLGIIDEYHAHKSSEVYDVIESSMGARLNPMLGIITTAGFNLQGPCYTLRKQYVEPLLRGQIEDDSYFALVYTLDEGDDPFDEANWIKANPSLGISKGIDTMREEAKKAQHMPSAKVNFLTKHCNVWVQSSSSFIDLAHWAKCPESYRDEELTTTKSVIAVDLARQWDWTCVAHLFNLPDGTRDVRLYSFLPEETMEKIPRQLASVYQGFIDAGYLQLTPGNIVDQNIVKDKIIELCLHNDVSEIAYDQYNASWLLGELSNELQGVELVGVSQSARGLSAGMGECAANIMDGKLRNNGNTALSWHLGNVVLRQADAKNMIPVKEHPDSKIDGAVALFMAYNRALNDHQPDIMGFLSSSNFVERG